MHWDRNGVMEQHDRVVEGTPIEASAQGTTPVEVVVAYVDDGGHYPRADRTNPALAYWKAIAVMATTLRVVGMDWPITVSTNRPPSDRMVLDVLERHDVQFRDTPFAHRPPKGWFDRFTGSLYLLDALADAVERVASGSRIMAVDPDCVWIRQPDPFIAALDRDPDALLAYEITYSPGQPALGLTLRQMGQLFREVGDVPVPDEPPYAGGEFLFASRDRLVALLVHADRIWEESLRRFEAGQAPKVNTEEHVLSYALGQVGWTGGTANRWMRRLWTESPPVRNVQGDEEDLVLWHVLTEKKRGLLELFDDIVAGHPALDRPGRRYRRHLAKRLRVHSNVAQHVNHQINRRLYYRRGGKRQWPVEW